MYSCGLLSETSHITKNCGLLSERLIIIKFQLLQRKVVSCEVNVHNLSGA